MLDWLAKARQLAEQQATGGDDTPMPTAWTWLASNIGQLLERLAAAEIVSEPRRYQHARDCNWHGKYPDYRSVGQDGIPRVLAMDRQTGATILQPCDCWRESVSC